MVPCPSPVLRPEGVHDKHRPQPVLPHHHMQTSPPTWSQFLAPILVGREVGATALCVPVCKSRVMDRNTNAVMVCVPLITASPVTTVEIPRKVDEVEVGDETVVIPRRVDEVDAKGEEPVSNPLETEDETMVDNPVQVEDETVVNDPENADGVEEEDEVVVDNPVVRKDEVVVTNPWELDGVEVEDEAVAGSP